MLLIFLHWLASVGCRSFSSFLLNVSSKYQLISSSPRVREQMLHACDHWQVPYNHSRNFSLLSRIGRSVFYLGGIIFIFTIIIALVSARLAHRASIIVSILLPVQDAVVQ